MGRTDEQTDLTSHLCYAVGTCESGNEPSGSIKSGEFLDLLRTG
jgi:hypothetical protein